MHLRARLALMALVLMLVPTIVLSVISIDSRIATMIDDMSRSTDFMIAQIFEEVRLALSQGDSDVVTALHSSQPVRKLLDSTVAFGPAVVAASIVAEDGTVIVAANGNIKACVHQITCRANRKEINPLRRADLLGHSVGTLRVINAVAV